MDLSRLNLVVLHAPGPGFKETKSEDSESGYPAREAGPPQREAARRPGPGPREGENDLAGARRVAGPSAAHRTGNHRPNLALRLRPRATSERKYGSCSGSACARHYAEVGPQREFWET